MFNIGDEDKEKLKDNMDEIKNLINKNEEPSTQNSEFEPVSQQNSTEAPKTSGTNQKEKEELEKELESSLQDLDQKDQQNNTESINKDFSNTSEPQNNQRPQKQQQKSPKQEANSNQGLQGDYRETQENVGTKTQNEGGSSPNFSGNSLFLRVERFRNIESLVGQMRDLTTQIDQQIDNLETTNSEDEQIKEETHRILSEFSSRRQEMEESIMKNN